MLQIIIDGGLIQSIESDDPDMIGQEIKVIDLDCEGEDDEYTDPVVFNGKDTRAVIGAALVTKVITIVKSDPNGD